MGDYVRLSRAGGNLYASHSEEGQRMLDTAKSLASRLRGKDEVEGASIAVAAGDFDHELVAALSTTRMDDRHLPLNALMD